MTNDNDLCFLSAREALAAFRDRTLSPVELMEAVIARAAGVETEINAFAYRRFDDAMRLAEVATKRYGATSEEPRPLEGLPVAVKMDVQIEGDPESPGSMAFPVGTATHTDVTPRRIIDAGGIVHARTTMPEFASASFTHTRLWGITRNPWKPAFGPGGSSGGSAAALAAGTTFLATGSDNAGSLRIPASFCGVVGYKPAHGRVPCPPPLNLDPYLSAGPMARTVSDCALFLNVLSGPDLSDPASFPNPIPIPADLGGIEGLRIAVSADLGGFPVEEEIRANTLAAAHNLEQAGAVVDDVEPAWDWREVLDAGRRHLELTVGALASRLTGQFADDLMPYISAFAGAIPTMTDDALMHTIEVESRAWEAFATLFARYDAVLCPTQGLLGFVAGDDYADHGPVINGEEVTYPFDTHITLPFNMMNTCPVMSVPSGFASNGVPTGVQVVGRPFDDATVFRVGRAVEALAAGGAPFVTSRRPPSP